MTVMHMPSLLSWVTLLDHQDRQSFYADLASAVARAQETDDAGAIEECLREWRLTAEAMANAELRDRLLDTDT